MYAWLTLEADVPDPALEIRWCRVPSAVVPDCPPDPLKQRTQRIAQTVKAAYPRLGAAEHNRLTKEAVVIAPLLPADPDVESFFIHTYLAHLLLPADQRQARERAIEDSIQTYFGGLAAHPAWLTDCLARVRLGALLAPTDWSDLYVASECGQHWRNLLAAPADALLAAPFTAQVLRMNSAVMQTAPGDLVSLLTPLFAALAVNPPADRDGFCEMVEWLCATGAVETLRTAVRLHTTVPGFCESALLLYGLTDMLRDAVRHARLPQDDTLAPEEIMQVTLNRCMAQRASRQRCTVLRTACAQRLNVPLGPLGASSREALARIHRQLQAVEDLVTPDRLRRTGRVSDADPAATDMDPVHAWSVSRLVQWIEGPLVTRAGEAPRRIERGWIAAQDEQARKEAAKQRSRTTHPNPRNSAQPPPVRKGFSEADIGRVVQDALAATARFFIDDIHELLPLAQALQAPAEPVEACRRMLEPLATLLQPGGRDDEARRQLGRTEAAISALRASIRAAQVTRNKQARFDSRLNAALRAEPLALGKRHGGVIGCAMTAADWPWVAETYHRRWLPMATGLTIDGKAVALRPDQALALYVTGSSHSDHAFDISVHLWQRRAGLDSTPTANGAPTMNTEDWFDTYLPCCVLHVPG